MTERKLTPFDYWKSIQQRKYIKDISGFSPIVMANLLSADEDLIYVVEISKCMPICQCDKFAPSMYIEQKQFTTIMEKIFSCTNA